MASANLTAARLREVLHYCPDTGGFTWRFSRRGVKAGSVAGSVSKEQGYRYICVDRRSYLAHRLAWLYMNGEWPAEQVDHKFGIRDDNRWSELRAANNTFNRQNMRAARHDNKSAGLLGVSIQRGNGDARYRARITTNGVEQLIGRFDTAEAAHAAYIEAKRRLHASCVI
jgi:hypothetical protein